MIRHPTDIMLYTCALMSFWAGLYGADMQGKILEGVKILVSCHYELVLVPPLSVPVCRALLLF